MEKKYNFALFCELIEAMFVTPMNKFKSDSTIKKLKKITVQKSSYITWKVQKNKTKKIHQKYTSKTAFSTTGNMKL